jgi:hypothetical protein
MEITLYIAGGILVLGAGLAHLGIRFWMKPVETPDEEVYWEFEEDDPGYERYTRWLQVSLAGMCLGVLLLFVAIAV